MDDLAFRQARLGWRGIAGLAAAGIGTYALVAHYGVAGAALIAGLTIGYLVARLTKL